MSCAACNLGRKWECETRGNCNVVVDRNVSGNGIGGITNGVLDEAETVSEYVPGKPEREIETYKTEQTLVDQQSTGRKRAALAYPLHPELYCEWQGKKNVGGGLKPIVGCINGLQQARHHGPDKNTLNNDEGNVHRICHTCHNRWHTENDPDYVWGQIYEPHSPTVATPSELLESQMHWATRQVVKAKD